MSLRPRLSRQPHLTFPPLFPSPSHIFCHPLLLPLNPFFTNALTSSAFLLSLLGFFSTRSLPHCCSFFFCLSAFPSQLFLNLLSFSLVLLYTLLTPMSQIYLLPCHLLLPFLRYTSAHVPVTPALFTFFLLRSRHAFPLFFFLTLFFSSLSSPYVSSPFLALPLPSLPSLLFP